MDVVLRDVKVLALELVQGYFALYIFLYGWDVYRELNFRHGCLDNVPLRLAPAHEMGRRTRALRL